MKIVKILYDETSSAVFQSIGSDTLQNRIVKDHKYEYRNISLCNVSNTIELIILSNEKEVAS